MTTTCCRPGGHATGFRVAFGAILTALIALSCSVFLSPSANAAQTVDQFVKANNGKSLDFDGRYGAQCVDLIQFYNRDVVGAPRLTGDAKEIYGSAPGSHYQKLGAGTKAAKGDIAVWGGQLGDGYGHVAVVLADKGGSMEVLTQNPGATHKATMSKSGMIGLLRPKNLPQPKPKPTPKPKPKPVVHNPEGKFDELTSPAPGKIRARGWALDRDNSGASIEVHLYVGGESGTAGAQGVRRKADVNRPDVNSALKVSGKHGFDTTFDTPKTGKQKVCAYAINIGGGSNRLLGCKDVTIKAVPAPSPSSPKPQPTTPAQPGPGTIDTGTASGFGSLGS